MSDGRATPYRAARFLDGDRVTPGSGKCQCRPDCEMPCWQRIGIAPACEACDCPPFPGEDGEYLEADALAAEDDEMPDCFHCHGSGLSPYSIRDIPCPYCGGRG